MLEKKGFYLKTLQGITKSSNPDWHGDPFTGKLKRLFLRGMTWLLLAMALTGIRTDRCGMCGDQSLSCCKRAGNVCNRGRWTVDRF